ncbi:hypothetical protein [Exiguobacterium antarcticum]|uniref:hypothetical protein n=1 Tax=Exiguobacterium antarcticum TaxID=132920 RepID=UPI0011D28AA4|nr:hypothetical protein [Exiguobacterium antarcticum]
MENKLLDIFYSYEYVHLNARPEESPGLIYFQGASGELFYPFLNGGPEIIGELPSEELTDAKRSFRQWAMRNQIVSELIRFNPLTENHKQVPGRKRNSSAND